MNQALIDMQNLARIVVNQPPVTHLDDAAWDRIYELAAKNWLLGALAAAINKMPQTQQPKEPQLIACANEVLQFQVEREKALKTEIIKLNQLLKPYAPILWLKGADDLLQNTFNIPGQRWMMDLDLLVPENNIRHAWDQLRENGYKLLKEDSTKSFDWQDNKWHDCPTVVSSNKIAIELHRYIGRLTSNHILNTNDFLKNSIPVKDWEQQTCHVLNVNHGLAHRIFHSQVFDNIEQRKLINLRYLFTTYKYLKCHEDEIDYLAIEKLFNEQGYKDTLKRFNYVIWYLFDYKTPLFDPNCETGVNYVKKAEKTLDSSTFSKIKKTLLIPIDIAIETLRPKNIVKNFGQPKTIFSWPVIYLKQIIKLTASLFSLTKWKETVKAFKRFQ